MTKVETKTEIETDFLTDNMDIELESGVLANKEKAINNHFCNLMVEMLKWEKRAPEIER